MFHHLSSFCIYVSFLCFLYYIYYPSAMLSRRPSNAAPALNETIMIHHGDPSFPLRFLDEKTSMQHRTGPDSGTSMRNRVLQTLNAISGSMLQLSLSLSPLCLQLVSLSLWTFRLLLFLSLGSSFAFNSKKPTHRGADSFDPTGGPLPESMCLHGPLPSAGRSRRASTIAPPTREQF